MQIGRIWQELYRSQYFEGGTCYSQRKAPLTLRYTILLEKP